MAFSSSVIIVQQGRRPEELERPQAGVAQEVDQRHVADQKCDPRSARLDPAQ